MCYRILMKRERKRKNLTQEQLAISLNVSQSDMSEWEAGKREIPIDIKKKIPDILDSSRLRLEIVNELDADLIVTPYYSGIKSDLIRLIAKNIEEEEESIKAQKELFNIVLENMTGKEYTKEQIEKISDLMEQIADPVGWKRMLLVGVEEEIGIPIKSINKRIQKKVISKSYTRIGGRH
ncbi:helix-turn-helix domain-containing protein [Tepidibacter hydrothermalis]|uniref:Helix-turn-helix transcriptional regulator n=1 Tax=Tepidibacter hydrothermalis TaxID=3036126 RepID=A0ABY8ED03_9FIRM|nr:helix-turn-helix transcriptional regulator [Tepidibacter hydrothermalis]WFD08745.1 helix-turn-helix transcriptional regulator [Tepidibacter hydrothermalis]